MVETAAAEEAAVVANGVCRHQAITIKKMKAAAKSAETTVVAAGGKRQQWWWQRPEMVPTVAEAVTATVAMATAIAG